MYPFIDPCLATLYIGRSDYENNIFSEVSCEITDINPPEIQESYWSPSPVSSDAWIFEDPFSSTSFRYESESDSSSARLAAGPEEQPLPLYIQPQFTSLPSQLPLDGPVSAIFDVTSDEIIEPSPVLQDRPIRLLPPRLGKSSPPLHTNTNYDSTQADSPTSLSIIEVPVSAPPLKKTRIEPKPEDLAEIRISHRHASRMARDKIHRQYIMFRNNCDSCPNEEDEDEIADNCSHYRCSYGKPSSPKAASSKTGTKRKRDAGQNTSHNREQKKPMRFPCPAPRCNKSFSRVHDMRRHVLTARTCPGYKAAKELKCDFCNVHMSRSDSLKRHLANDCPYLDRR